MHTSPIGFEQDSERHADPERPVRRRRRKGRPLRATARFDADEWGAVCAAATGAGLTPRGWLAAVGTAAARREPPPRWRTVEPQLVELAALRKQLVRVGTLLNQAVRSVNATGDVPPGLPYLCGRVEMLICELDRLTARLVQRG